MNRPQDDHDAPESEAPGCENPGAARDAGAASRPRRGYQAVQDQAFALFLRSALHAGLDPELDSPIPPALRRLIEDHAAPRR